MRRRGSPWSSPSKDEPPAPGSGVRASLLVGTLALVLIHLTLWVHHAYL